MNAPARPNAFPTRRALYRWLGWFTASNAALYLLVSLRYLPVVQAPDSAVTAVYVVTTFIGHAALLAVVPAFLLLAPMVAIRPSRTVVVPLAVLIAAAGLTLLVVDTTMFVERRFHLSLFTVVLFETSTWILSALVMVIALAFESVLAGTVGRWTGRAGRRRWLGPVAGGLLAGCWLLSQGIHIWADAFGYSPVTRVTAVLPLYYPIHAKRMLARLGWVDEAQVREARLLRKARGDTGDGELRYPLEPLRCSPPAQPPNLLWILIDALRPDAIGPEVTPTIARFAESGQQFADHWSGGNSSRMGVFSMFYGLPSTYWQTFYVNERPPVLLDELRAQGYEIMTSSAVGYGSPTLIDRTVFAGVDGLEPESPAPGVQKNAEVTADWRLWLGNRRSATPFMAFLYYDPPFGAELPAGRELSNDHRYDGNGERARTLWHDYRLGLHRVDAEVAQVLASLESAGLDASTVVMITSDHGYEFDDLGLGYYGHASNFSRHQLRATLLMHWPGREPASYAHRTSHLDVPVTLLGDLLGCANPPSDYSVGRNLFAGRSWDWIIAGSYHAHAIVEPRRITVSEPGGFAEVLGPDYRPLDKGGLDAGLIERAMADMRRFYR